MCGSRSLSNSEESIASEAFLEPSAICLSVAIFFSPCLRVALSTKD
jgi:hypothetical protein